MENKKYKMKIKRKTLIPIIAIALFIILFIPIPKGVLKDGGTKELTSLTYKIVFWNRLGDDGYVYNRTKIYLFPDNFRSIDNLWQKESKSHGNTDDSEEKSFIAEIIELNSSSVLVSPFEGEDILNSSDKISFGIKDLEEINAKVGDIVEITYTGYVMETYPAQINATSWKMIHRKV